MLNSWYDLWRLVTIPDFRIARHKQGVQLHLTSRLFDSKRADRRPCRPPCKRYLRHALQYILFSKRLGVVSNRKELFSLFLHACNFYATKINPVLGFDSSLCKVNVCLPSTASPASQSIESHTVLVAPTCKSTDLQMPNGAVRTHSLTASH